MIHMLKILPVHFDDLMEGRKTFEVRCNDRNFQVGDELMLREWNGVDYTGNVLSFTVSHMLEDPTYLKEGYVILSLQ